MIEVGDPLVGSVVLRPGRVHARALDSAWAVAFDVEMRALCPVSPYLHGHNLYLCIYLYICIDEHDQDLEPHAGEHPHQRCVCQHSLPTPVGPSALEEEIAREHDNEYVRA
jgi:hypothetical protein